MAKQIYIDRPPRIQPELPRGEREVPNPPENEENPGALLQQAMLPIVTIIGYVLVAALGQGGGRNSMIMIPMALSVVASVALAIYVGRREKQQREEKDALYARRITELRREMESEHAAQRHFYHYNYPELERSLAIVEDIKRETGKKEEIRSGTRLWERRTSDADFAVLRLGISALPSTVSYKISQGEKVENPIVRQAIRLVEDSRYVDHVPVTVSLRLPPGTKKDETSDINIRHSLGISGNKEQVYPYVQSLLVDYTTFQSPADTRLFIVGTHAAKQAWRWAYDLPHCRESDGSQTLAFEEAEKPLTDKEADRLRAFWKSLRTLLENRKIRLEDKEKSGDVTIPFILVIVDLLEPAPDWSSLKDPESDAAISTILMEGQRLGAAIVFLEPERSKVPSQCLAVLEVDTTENKPEACTFRYAETEVNTYRFVGTTQIPTQTEAIRDFAHSLAPLAVRAGFGSNLASTVTLLEVNNLSDLEELVAFANKSWRESKQPANADWLNVNVGLMSGNDVRKLIFSAKADGVHGLIAGSTGSGKSELLMTLILGLALNYDPSVCNFVLIDYKGGAAFDPFKKLPHTVDIVTNLDAAATGRVFASIIAELERRQKLNTNEQIKDIVDYRAKGFTLKKDAPYPHLFIIIDEFAEMIANNAEFKAQLESITRLGRSLGVHLILAAQRPSGVTDQMRANIKFRICLRVETPDDSRELLRRQDAAFLPPGIPGRGYIQVGNENIELIQTAYTGGAYLGPQKENVSPDVIWLDRPSKTKKEAGDEPKKLYEVIVEQFNILAQQESKPQWRPWPAFLPAKLALESAVDTAYMRDEDVADMAATATDWEGEKNTLPLNGAVCQYTAGSLKWHGIDWSKYAMRPIIGLVDNPYKACQKPLKIDFISGHAVIFGAPGWGKSNMLQSVIVSLTATHTPEELHIYIMDLGGRTMQVFQDLPHVGAIINSDEDERIQRLMRKLNDILEERQRLFSDEQVNNLSAYNLKHPTTILPAILVVIDNFAEFREYFENLMPPLISLVRECCAIGIHFLFSTDFPNSLTNKLYNLIPNRMTFKLSDASEYTNIVGRGAVEMSPIAGRGLIRLDNMPLEFQCAIPFEEKPGDPNMIEKLREYSKKMAEIWDNAWKGEPPISIKVLPTRILLERLINEYPPAPGKHIAPVIGIDDRNLLPYYLDLEKYGPHLVIPATPLAGKTTALRTIALSLAYQYAPEEAMLIMVDLQNHLYNYGGEHSLSELPHVVDCINDAAQFDELLDNLRVECLGLEVKGKKRRIFLLIDNYDSFSEEGNRSATFMDGMVALTRKFQTLGLYIVAAGSISMRNAHDDLRKLITASNFGLALKNAEAVNSLNGRYPRALSEVELPNGRGFMIRSGITSMLQIATPGSNNDEDMEQTLDEWVKRILSQYPGKKLTWQRKPKAAPKYDIDEIKARLIEMGTPEGLFVGMDYDNFVDMAQHYNLIDKLTVKE